MIDSAGEDPDLTYDAALRKVLGYCVDAVPNADVAVSSSASLLESALISIEMVEWLSATRPDPIHDIGRWLGAQEQINSEMREAMTKLRRVIHAMRSVCPTADNQLTH